MCVHCTVHDCCTQYWTEQTWQFSLLPSRQLSLLRWCLFKGRGELKGNRLAQADLEKSLLKQTQRNLWKLLALYLLQSEWLSWCLHESNENKKNAPPYEAGYQTCYQTWLDRYTPIQQNTWTKFCKNLPITINNCGRHLPQVFP